MHLKRLNGLHEMVSFSHNLDRVCLLFLKALTKRSPDVHVTSTSMPPSNESLLSVQLASFLTSLDDLSVALLSLRRCPAMRASGS